MMRYAVVLALLMAEIVLSPAALAGGDEYFRVDEVTMSLDGVDAMLEVNYTLDSFARLYVLALGCKHLEPDLVQLFMNYGHVQTVSVDPYRAVLLATDAGQYKGGYYLFDSRSLGMRIDKLRVVYPGGMYRTFYNVTSTPNVFVEVGDLDAGLGQGEQVLGKKA